MAKRELSTTLRNLKFMQRSCPKEEPKPPAKRDEEEQQQQQESFGGSTGDPKKRCVVIMEGNPHPGALKGRMSFRSFNPSIDKLHQEAANMYQTPAANTNHQSSGPERNELLLQSRGSESQEVANTSIDQDIDLKRKQPEMEMDTPSPNKLQKVATGESSGQSSSQNGMRGSDRQQKREKLDWNVLRPPKPHIKRR